MNKTRATRSCMTNGIFFINTNNVEVHRIGSLPDEVLTHILSFLSTKEAVQTCILSKRWRNTWATVPVLDIKQKHSLIDYSYKELRMSLARFERFMAGFLDNRAPTNLNRVRCVCQSDASMGWLDRVVLLMPLQIHIFILSNGNSLDMLDLVFSCASLQHLLMSIYPEYTEVITIIRPVSINLPSLKFLELTWVELHDDFAQKLFVGCPSLERLILRCCNLYFSVMSSEVLKELTLSSCGLHEQMQISCHALVSLYIRIDHKRSVISLKNMSSLVNVVIKLYWDLDDEVPVLNFFGGLSNAAKLESHLETPLLMEQLENDIPNCCSIFNNLKKLVVGGKCDLFYDFTLIACFLKHSPNLKELGLLLLDESQGQIQEPRREVLGDILFKYEYLETVKISDEYGGKLSSKLINAMVKTLGTYVKKIGNIIIT